MYRQARACKVVETFCLHRTVDSLKSSLTCQASFPCSTQVSVHVPANCQLPRVARLENQALFHMGNKVPVLLVPRDVTIMSERQHSSFNVHFTLYCPNSRIKLFADGYPTRKNYESLVPRKFKRIQYASN